MADLHVELLAVADCPHFERTRRDLESVLREGIIETPIQVVLVETLDDAEFLGFQGSPTVRIDGEDVVPQPDLPVGLGCRIYRDQNGNVSGGPPIERLREIVTNHRRGRLEAFRRDEAGRVAEFARRADAAEAADAADDAGHTEEQEGGR